MRERAPGVYGGREAAPNLSFFLPSLTSSSGTDSLDSVSSLLVISFPLPNLFFKSSFLLFAW